MILPYLRKISKVSIKKKKKLDHSPGQNRGMVHWALANCHSHPPSSLQYYEGLFYPKTIMVKRISNIQGTRTRRRWATRVCWSRLPTTSAASWERTTLPRSRFFGENFSQGLYIAFLVVLEKKKNIYLKGSLIEFSNLWFFKNNLC